MRAAPNAFLFAIVLGVVAAAAGSFAKDKPKEKAPPAKAEKVHEPTNACGCYRNSNGGCVCTDKKGKCECPGECEPVGCDKKREQDLEKEMAAEVKRAQDDEKRRHDEEAAKERSAAADAGITPEPSAAETPARSESAPAKGSKSTKPGRK
jgi:hypothetical protein